MYSCDASCRCKNFCDGSVNWLPLCADVHGFISNKALFDQYNIPLPTDYESFVAACHAFEEVGIRVHVSDYFYDYTCMETLQGLSIPQLTSMEGLKWRTAYSDPASTDHVGLDDTVWWKMSKVDSNRSTATLCQLSVALPSKLKRARVATP